MQRVLICGVAAAALALPAAATAQGFPGGGGGGFGGGGFGGGPPGGGRGGPPGGAPGEVGGVVVQVDRTAPRTSIDRRSYSVADELQSTTGGIADALRNVPSVQVDVDGEVSLRGDSNVTILVDGKPSALFTGEGRGAALQQLPADQIDRVEVITNPSAAFNAEGSGGIINLVTKASFRPGYTGSVRANVGNMGRYNGGANAAMQGRKLALTGGVNLRHDENKNTIVDERTRRDLTGAVTNTTVQNGTGRSENDIKTARLGFNYQSDPRTRFGGELSYRSFGSSSQSTDRQDQSNGAGLLTRRFDRYSTNENDRDSYEISANFSRAFTGDDHELRASASHEITDESRLRQVSSLNLVPATPTSFERFDFDGRQVQSEIRIDYTRPMPKSATLKLGYALDRDDNTYDNLGRTGTSLSSLGVAANLTYLYEFKQTIHAGYLTYQQPLGDFTVLGGLRLENSDIDLALPTTATRVDNGYTYLYPSLHTTYQLSDRDTLSASYAMRVQRPRADDLNPFLVYIDPFNFRQGNPNLRPQKTNSYELGYQHRRNGSFYQATLYYRQASGGISDVVQDLGGGVLLTTRANLRESRSGGLELVANGRLNSKITYNASTNLAWNQIDASSAGVAGKRDAFVVSGRANINWQVTSKDFLQVNAFASGKRLTAQGYSTGFTSVNLGYRHRFSDKLAGVATANDIFDTSNVRQVFDTPTLTGTSRREFSRRGFYVGLVWTFGGQQQQRGRGQGDPGFEFGGGDDAGGPGGP